MLEKHDDFFRDFRGDTIHPSTLEVLDELGLGDRFAEVPQQLVSQLRAMTDEGMVSLVDLDELAVAHPYIAFVPQWDFLDFLTDAARELPNFELRMGAEVEDLVETARRVSGVRYRSVDGLREVAATLTIATDGRDSVVRRRAGLKPVAFGAPMDVLWFRLSREETDPDATFGRFSAGHIVAMINRGDYWQVGYAIPKGSDAVLRRQGIDRLRSSLAALMPPFANRAQREPAGTTSRRSRSRSTASGAGIGRVCSASGTPPMRCPRSAESGQPRGPRRRRGRQSAGPAVEGGHARRARLGAGRPAAPVADRGDPGIPASRGASRARSDAPGHKRRDAESGTRPRAHRFPATAPRAAPRGGSVARARAHRARGGRLGAAALRRGHALSCAAGRSARG